MQEDYQKFEKQYMNLISKKVKLARKAQSYSQECMAEKVECSREFINRIENRKEDLSLKMLLKLAYSLDIPPDDFLSIN